MLRQTSEAGVVRFRGFAGRYRIRGTGGEAIVVVDGGPGREAPIEARLITSPASLVPSR